LAKRSGVKNVLALMVNGTISDLAANVPETATV
jgi:hypothetical protein